MAFDLAEYPLAFMLPSNASPHSAWLMHVPLAPIIVELLAPRTLVELGTHWGDSYMAFCRAVRSLNLQTKCSAVDTWRGDPHAGFYGPDVLANLRQMHDARYGDFSQLIQATFDEARPRFDDGSIDLLHIDGMHDYQSVRHDFDSWRPKLSERGVVLFHDTAERNPPYEVWKLWEELRGGLPSAEMPFGHGLGILAVGRNVPPAFLDFLKAVNTRPVLVRSLAFLGLHIQILSQYIGTAGVIHDCQTAMNQWRTRTGQPIVNQAPSLQHVMDNIWEAGDAVREEVRRLAAGAGGEGPRPG